MRKQGFTMIELLVVMALIAILAAVLIPSAGAAIESSKKKRAEADCFKIATAIQSYWNEYGRMPVPIDKQGYKPGSGDPNDGDQAFGDEQVHGFYEEADAADIIKVLMGAENGQFSSTEWNDLNPRSKAYLKLGSSSAQSGKVRDPWGNFYSIKLDVDYNGLIQYLSGTDQHRTSAVVISYGKDGRTGAERSQAVQDNVCNVEIIK